MLFGHVWRLLLQFLGHETLLRGYMLMLLLTDNIEQGNRVNLGVLAKGNLALWSKMGYGDENSSEKGTHLYLCQS
jgi:hypothetical protein